MKATLTLARWLGPWADPKRAPDVSIEEDDLDGMRIRRYRDRAALDPKPYLIAPGLHYAGADDPRMDRFCRILAAAGHHVIAPYIPSFLALRPDAQAKRDFIKAFHGLPRWTGGRKPVVFSISFGSLLAFALAAEHGESVDRLVIFGGYSDFRDMLKFCLTGSVSSPDSGSRSTRPLATQPRHGPRLASVGRTAVRDPLNQPVVLMNLLHLIPCADREAVSAGWVRYVKATWGRPEMKERARFVAVAEKLAPSIPDSVRELFLIGIGARPGAAPLALDALTRFDASELDPAPYLPRIRNRVDLVHGMDDDVIPYEHSHALGKLLPDARVHVTGMYGHTGVSRPGVSMITRELATMIRVLRAFG